VHVLDSKTWRACVTLVEARLGESRSLRVHQTLSVVGPSELTCTLIVSRAGERESSKGHLSPCQYTNAGIIVV